jgi:hypothetical protein
MSDHEGGCLCGKLRYRVTAPPIDSGYCHCRMCQRNSGAPVVAWTTFPSSGFTWMTGTPATYASSAHAQRQFCSACGSYILFQNDEAPGEVSINTASFDDPQAFPPRMHIFAEARISWFRTDDNLPVYNGYGPFDRRS